MREILFRGKRVDNGEWVEGCFGRHTSLDAFIIDRPYPAMSGELSALGFYEVDPATVGQFTELYDKNGEKIFEGDIVDILTENEEIGVVNYEDGGFLVDADGFCVDFHANINGNDVEVIGNIHDNPELLEG